MNEISELIYVLENVILNQEAFGEEDLESEDYENYLKIKELSKTKNAIDSRRLRVNYGLRSKIYERIFSHIPTKSKFSLRERNIIDVIKLQAIAQLLEGFRAFNYSNKLNKTLLSKSRKYSHTTGIFSSSRELFKGESDRGNINKARKYYHECTNALHQISFEIKAEWYASELRNHFRISKEITKEIREKAVLYFEELNRIPEEERTRLFYRHFFNVAIIHFESIFDFESLCKFLEQSIISISKRFQDENTILMLRLYLINYSLRVKAFAITKEQLEIGYRSTPPNSSRWFRLKDLEMLFALRTSSPEKCIGIYDEVKSEGRYKQLSSVMQNRIELQWLYGIMCQALALGKEKGRALIKEVRIARFLNSIPDFVVDKKGMNVSIIIVQLLYYIILEDLNKLDDRFEAVEKYLTRYMRNDPLYRSNCFVKMLLQVPKQNFHPVAVERHAARHLKNLHTMPFLKSKHPNEIEVVEYEILWALIENYLKGVKTA